MSRAGTTTFPGTLGYNEINTRPATVITSVLTAADTEEGFIALTAGSGDGEGLTPAMFCAEATGTHEFWQYISGNIVRMSADASTIDT